MFKFITIMVLSLSSQAFAKAPSKIDVFCKIGSANAVLISLEDCDNRIDHYQYGPYWCSGKIDDNFSVRFLGYSGTGSGEIRITYLPMKFSGISPLQIGEQKISCQLDGFD